MLKELISEAIECFGSQTVSEVLETVHFADPDAAYTTYQDMNMDEHAECVEFLFF